MNDSAAANKFYAHLFGWKIDPSNPMNYGIVDTDSKGEGIGGGSPSLPMAAGRTRLYVNVDDVQYNLNEAEKLAPRRSCRRCRSSTGPRSRCSRTLDGNVIGLSKM